MILVNKAYRMEYTIHNANIFSGKNYLLASQHLPHSGFITKILIIGYIPERDSSAIYWPSAKHELLNCQDGVLQPIYSTVQEKTTRCQPQPVYTATRCFPPAGTHWSITSQLQAFAGVICPVCAWLNMHIPYIHAVGVLWCVWFQYYN